MNLLKQIKLKMYNPLKRADFYKSTGLNIGSDCWIGSNVSFGSEPYLIKIGDHVRINSNVSFNTHDGGAWVLRGLAGNGEQGIPSEMENADLFGSIVVGNNVHIGTNSFIMPGVKIGNNCIIGIGAIVTKDIPDNSVAVGVPARVIENVQEYYEKHKDEFVYTKNLTATEKKDFLLNSKH